MCEQCCAATIFFGEVFPGWYLVRARRDGHFMKKAQWGLVRQNDPEFYWDITPIDDDSDENFDIFTEKLEQFEEQFYSDFDSSVALLQSIFKRRLSKFFLRPFKLTKRPTYDLFKYLGKFIKNSKPEADEDPGLDGFGPVDTTIWKD